MLPTIKSIMYKKRPEILFLWDLFSSETVIPGLGRSSEGARMTHHLPGTWMRKMTSNFLSSMAEDIAAVQSHKWPIYRLLININ